MAPTHDAFTIFLDGECPLCRREGAMLTVTWQGQEPVTRFAGKEGGAITLRLSEYLAGSGSTPGSVPRNPRLGGSRT